MNTSKHRQHRFWKLWSNSGAIQEPIKRYIHPFVTNPPSIERVVHKISHISDLLTRLIEHVQSIPIEAREKARLLEELDDARYQTCQCEYHLAKEYLGHVLPDNDSELRSVRRRILRIIDLLAWCRENDRRISYYWEKAPSDKAA